MTNIFLKMASLKIQNNVQKIDAIVSKINPKHPYLPCFEYPFVSHVNYHPLSRLQRHVITVIAAIRSSCAKHFFGLIGLFLHRYYCDSFMFVGNGYCRRHFIFCVFFFSVIYIYDP